MKDLKKVQEFFSKPLEEVTNDYSPLSYAKLVANGKMDIEDAMKETGFSYVLLKQLVDKVKGVAQNIREEFKEVYDYVITWNGWYPRLPFDLFTPTADDLLRQKNYFNLANTNALISNLNIDMRTATNVGGAEGQNQNATYFNDYLHLKQAGYDTGLVPKFTEAFNQLFTF